MPHHIGLCYDKGVPTLRAHLPNMNDAVVPCFLSADKDHRYDFEEASRNRGIAEQRYVVEVTYARVKRWGMLKPIVPRNEFHHLNNVWWWALGFCNLNYKHFRQPGNASSAAGDHAANSAGSDDDSVDIDLTSDEIVDMMVALVCRVSED
mmetsp:Transcript_21601/g.55574  ORF Transcript_21601/g.55574 Transcript_21601/m.55574 type:complete len:150 (+) Transcript_21601:989-1438(+)